MQLYVAVEMGEAYAKRSTTVRAILFVQEYVVLQDIHSTLVFVVVFRTLIDRVPYVCVSRQRSGASEKVIE